MVGRWTIDWGVPDKALVRSGQATAIIRAEVHHPDRMSLIEVAIQTVGRNRILVNKQSVTRRRDLAEQLRVTVFAPDDLALVKGGPPGRRDLLDDLLVATAPRFSAIITDYERVVKQRNALLRAGIRDADDRRTRDVFDARDLSRPVARSSAVASTRSPSSHRRSSGPTYRSRDQHRAW